MRRQCKRRIAITKITRAELTDARTVAAIFSISASATFRQLAPVTLDQKHLA